MPKFGDIQCKDPSLPLLGLFLCALCEDELHMICGSQVQQDIKYHSVCMTCRICVSHQNEVLRDQGMEEVPLLQVVQRRNTHRLHQHRGVTAQQLSSSTSQPATGRGKSPSPTAIFLSETTKVTKAARVHGPTTMAAQVPAPMTKAALVRENTSLASHVRSRKSPNTIETEGPLSNRNKATGVACGTAEGTSSTSQPAAGRGKTPSPTAIILSETTEVTKAARVPGPTTMAAQVPAPMTKAALVRDNTSLASHVRGRKSPNTIETEGPLSNRNKATVARGTTSQACNKRVGVALHNEKVKATRTTVTEQFFRKCAGCSLSTSDAYRCKFCNTAVHIFCSIEPEELGHGAHYTCPRCHDAKGREADEDLSELPAKTSADTEGVVTVLPSAIARNRLGHRKYFFY
jgi:hypothetical protein